MARTPHRDRVHGTNRERHQVRCRRDHWKVRYRDKAEAVAAMHRICGSVDADLRDELPCRCYLCPFCRGWHHTAQPEQGV